MQQRVQAINEIGNFTSHCIFNIQWHQGLAIEVAMEAIWCHISVDKKHTLSCLAGCMMALSSTVGCVKWSHNPWLLLDQCNDHI